MVRLNMFGSSNKNKKKIQISLSKNSISPFVPFIFVHDFYWFHYCYCCLYCLNLLLQPIFCDEIASIFSDHFNNNKNSAIENVNPVNISNKTTDSFETFQRYSFDITDERINNDINNHKPNVSIIRSSFYHRKHNRRHQLHRKLKKLLKQQQNKLNKRFKSLKSRNNRTLIEPSPSKNHSSHVGSPLEESMDDELYDDYFSLLNNDTLDLFEYENSGKPKQRHNQRHHRHDSNQGQHHSRLHKRKPNIIFILTDDQDIELGSMNYMPKVMKIMAEGGVHVKNAYSTTPMCCPSRSSILTGLYVHNHNVYTNGENCSSLKWQQTHERKTFATYLNEIGYRTAYFGKYLNEYNGSYIPPGWSDWSALIRNSRYYNYTLNVNGDKVRHGFDYNLDYYPDLILNDSLQYLRYSKRFFSSKPYLLVLSFPSPHGPEDSAPQYQHMFLKEKLHRTISWNYAPNGDKQWLLRNTPKMSPIHQEFTDFLNSKRLQTLQSVDEAVYQIFNELINLGELDNTYIIYTSDHGYHLGQFGLVKGKAMPFEFDIRVPFYVRGPDVPAGQILSQIVLNIDIAPTLLDIAGLQIPAHMDGMSFLPSIKKLADKTTTLKSKSQSKTNGRDSFLIERGKFKMFNNVDRLLIPIIGKKQWLQLQCLKPEYQSPCKPDQRFECFMNDQDVQRIRKCSPIHSMRSRKNSNGQCICPPYLNSDLRNNHKLKHRNSPRMKKIQTTNKNGSKKNRQMNQRHRRSDELILPFQDESYIDFDVQGVFELKRLIEISKSSLGGSFESTLNNQSIKPSNRLATTTNNSNASNVANITTSQLVSILNNSDETFADLANYTDYLNRTFCTVIRSNLSIECSEEIYSNHEAWREKKDYINAAIMELQRRLFELKGIRRYINENRPSNPKKLPDNEENECFCQSMFVNGRRRDNNDYHQAKANVTDLYRIGPSRQALAYNHQQAHNKPTRHRTFNLKRWLRRREKKIRRRGKFENTECEVAANEQMNCFTHDNDHWRTPPLWKNGPFCFCQNSLNSSFWCMRTINETHNNLYCEFVTGFLSFYDLDKDPFQLRNLIYDLDFNLVEELSRRLAHLKSCSGSLDCATFPSNHIVTNTSLPQPAKPTTKSASIRNNPTSSKQQQQRKKSQVVVIDRKRRRLPERHIT